MKLSLSQSFSHLQETRRKKKEKFHFYYDQPNQTKLWLSKGSQANLIFPSLKKIHTATHTHTQKKKNERMIVENNYMFVGNNNCLLQFYCNNFSFYFLHPLSHSLSLSLSLSLLNIHCKHERTTWLACFCMCMCVSVCMWFKYFRFYLWL